MVGYLVFPKLTRMEKINSSFVKNVMVVFGMDAEKQIEVEIQYHSSSY
jgi:hypothetical protein